MATGVLHGGEKNMRRVDMRRLDSEGDGGV